MKNSIAIFGLGISNLAVIREMVKQGVEVIAWDDNEAARDKAVALGAKIENLTLEVLQKCRMLILAPGVPFTYNPHPVVTHARTAGLEIICDIELRYREGWNCKTVGITGTNGKSTTTALIGHILKESGLNTAVGGNIGKAIFDLDVPDENGVLVLELSSYQIDLCPTFKPDIAVLMNITPDHLDRHGTMDEYAVAKARLFEGEGAAVITGSDEYSRKIAQNTGRKLLGIPEGLMEYATLRGAHNIQNMQAAFAVCKELGVPEDTIIKAFKSFPGLPHRQFVTRRIGLVEYINDSKATNAEATTKALASFENIFWIAGGRPKEGGLAGVSPFLSHVKKTYLIGESQQDFANYLKGHDAEFELCGTLDKALTAAHKDAQSSKENAVVLLSPAAASFDQYKNFEERGDHFTKLVEAL